MSWQQPGTPVSYGGANHGLHAVLTVLSCGMWAPVWIIAALVQRPQTVTATVPVYFPHGTLSVSGTHYWDAYRNSWQEVRREYTALPGAHSGAGTEEEVGGGRA